MWKKKKTSWILHITVSESSCVRAWVWSVSSFKETAAGCVRHKPERFPRHCWLSWDRSRRSDGRGACYLEWLWMDVGYATLMCITTQWTSCYSYTHALLHAGTVGTLQLKQIKDLSAKVIIADKGTIHLISMVFTQRTFPSTPWSRFLLKLLSFI